MLMAKRKTGKKVEFYNWIMYTLSLARAIKFKIKRDTCNVYKLKLNRHPPSISDYTWYIISYITGTCNHVEMLQVMRSNEIVINLGEFELGRQLN